MITSATGDDAGYSRLHAEAERYRHLVANSKLIPWELDLATWRFTHVGPQAERILGFPIEDWYEPGFWQAHFAPDDRDEHVASAASASVDEEKVFEYRIVAADGRTVWIRDFVGVVRGPGGVATGLRGIMLDISAERRAQEALAASEQRFRDFAEASSDWFWETDENHIFTRVSEGTQSKLGIAPEWFIGRCRLDTAATDPKTMEEHKRQLAAHEPFREMLVLFRSQHGDHWIRSSGVPVFDEAGRFRGYRGSGSNITAQIETERETRSALALLESALASINDGFALFDANDNFVTCNAVYRGFLGEAAVVLEGGATYEAIVRKVVDVGLVRQALADPETWIRRRMALHREQSGPLQFEATDGRWLRIQESRMPDGGTVIIFADITANVHAERETNRALTLFKSAIDSIPDGFALFDAEDRFVTCNEPYRRPRGEPAVDIEPGTPFESLIRGDVERGQIPGAEEDPEGWIRRRMEMHRNPQGPFELERKNRWLRIQESRTPDGGTVIVLTDITGEKQREEQLRQTQKMDALGKLTGGLAHDFNNLLAVIAGNMELVAEELGDRPDLRAKAETAIRASERGATLTRGLLAFARQQPQQLTEVDLNLVANDMSELIRRAIPANIAIQVVPGEGVWHCAVDAGLLQNALLNLALNARDAMPDGGDLIIRTAADRIDEESAARRGGMKPGDYAVLAVSDTGAGMPPDVADRAFEPFFTMKAVGKGTGLGLSMVYGFARQSGGHAAITSVPGQGTTVRLWLPRWREAVAPSARTAQPKRRTGGGETVLVVDDDPDLLDLVGTQLEALGYRVVRASDGMAGLAQIARHPDVSALLTDVVLAGGVSGPELVRRAQSVRPDLRVVLMSGYVAESVQREGFDDLGARLLQKPFTREHLSAAIRDALDGGPVDTPGPA